MMLSVPYIRFTVKESLRCSLLSCLFVLIEHKLLSQSPYLNLCGWVFAGVQFRVVTSPCWRRKWQPSPVFLPGKSHGQRSLVDYSPGDHKSHRTYQLNHHHPTKSVFAGGSEDKASACHAGDPGLISGLGRSPEEVNGNPLQYSCLNYLMDGGAWRATVHGVAKSQTQLSN